MYILGIESTAHTIGASVMKGKKILSNVKDTYKSDKAGFKPREIAEHNYSLAISIIKKALSDAGISIKDIDLLSFSRGPGFGQCLAVASTIARTIKNYYGIDAIGVNHCIAHIEIGKLESSFKDPVVVFASGANTQILAYKKGYYRIFGETLDMGIGNAIDHLGRYFGIAFPAGPVMSELYYKGSYIDLPYTVKGMDLAFSGILTAARKLIGKEKKEDIIYSFMNTIYSMLLEVSERALSYSSKKELLLVGGVAASKPLQDMLNVLAKERDIKVAWPSKEFAGDNAAMIAYLGYLMYSNGLRQNDNELLPKPKERIDSVKINYMY